MARSVYVSREPSSGNEGPAEREASSSPATSFSSDKENRAAKEVDQSTTASEAPSRKRRKLGDKDAQNSATSGSPLTTSSTTERSLLSTQYYDPDQDPDERRRVVKEMRELTRDVNGMRLAMDRQAVLSPPN